MFGSEMQENSANKLFPTQLFSDTSENSLESSWIGTEKSYKLKDSLANFKLTKNGEKMYFCQIVSNIVNIYSFY